MNNNEGEVILLADKKLYHEQVPMKAMFFVGFFRGLSKYDF